MNSTSNFNYFEGASLSELFAKDISDGRYGFILNYPATAKWAAYPNRKKYFIQDGSSEATKTSFDKICQKEPWKNLAVLGDKVPGIVIIDPPKSLINYWQEYLGFSDASMAMLDCSTYLEDLSQSEQFDKLITLFPFDNLAPEKHAVNPDSHYHLLSKASLAEMGVQCPKYSTYNLHEVSLESINLPEQFPYLIKTSHGLSGEGTYIIKNPSDLNYCLEEVRKYLEIKLLDTIIISEFVADVEKNYCVQFYVSKEGEIKLIGTTGQLVTEDGNYLGGVIDYSQDLTPFFEMIAAMGESARKQGYFGVIGFDVLEDKDGQFYVIDANFRVNGSTPLCLQRHRLLKEGKQVAKYSSDYRISGTLESILTTLKPELESKDFIILSALEKAKYGNIYTEIYGIVAGETMEQMQATEENLHKKGLDW
ncbi:ATP-grasp domain-containing protein [Ancylothrix sp. C2]|uniref:ATP-grasp domain-containing protein n=1 Tax=Ancylothrix sp. D3o TaxID=2953691 RepID=UPI0021BB9871|nr:ATP-grasp domain-containing protein [Ancylothrix sp. D3o]MCT7951991.1 ATP-grasp domain-containing protein [Ancylothrix sp. D3o]